MRCPAFFDEVARIAMHDPLADLLGAVEGGLIEYGYRDAVKLAGHSCPTVAGAYLMTLKSLRRLYPERPPPRGALRVELRASQDEGVAGVMASVAGLITGAAGLGGFKGLGGKYARRDLLAFEAPFDAEMRFTRQDTGASVSASYHPEVVAPAPDMRALLPGVLSGQANAAERTEFGRLWQERVRRILVDHFDDPALVVLDAY